MIQSDSEPWSENPVIIPLENRIDLHTFLPGEIPDLLEEYIRECKQAGFGRVTIIHGKGSGMLRKRVHACLQKNPLIERFYQAPPEEGGWGATIAVLRNSLR